MIDASKGFLKDGNKIGCAPKIFIKSSPSSMHRRNYPAIPAWCQCLKSPTLRTPIISISHAILMPVNLRFTRPRRTPQRRHSRHRYRRTQRLLDGLSDAPQRLIQGYGRPGYSDPLVEAHEVRMTILTHSEFQSYQQRVDTVFEGCVRHTRILCQTLGATRFRERSFGACRKTYWSGLTICRCLIGMSLSAVDGLLG